MRPVPTQTPSPSSAKFAIATSAPVNRSFDFVPSTFLRCTDEVPAAYRSDSIVPSASPNRNRHSSLQYLPSSPQQSIFLTDIRSCTSNCSPPASPLHQRAPSESTIDLCLTLSKRRNIPAMQSSPGKGLVVTLCSCSLNDPNLTVSPRSLEYPEDFGPAPSPPPVIPVNPSMTTPGV